MNNILPKIIYTLILCLTAYVFPVAHANATPSVLFSPTTATVNQNDTFQAKVNINVDTNNALSADAIVNYAPADLEVTAVSSGGFFPEFSYANNSQTGLIEIHGYTTSGNSNITGTGILANIIFKAKKNSGSSSVSYLCNGSTSNTNILTTAGQNILQCTQVNVIGVIYSGSTNPTNTLTPTPTTPPGSTPTTTPTPTQGSGSNTLPVCSTLSVSTSTATGTPLEVSFTCSGVDTDGYINAVEFSFGDGTTQVVEKNIGGNGSLSTNHTYTTIGALGASCRVRDNNQVYSYTSDGCKKVITINPKPVKSTRRIAYAGIDENYVTPTPTEIPPIVDIIEETPEPTYEPEPTTAPEVEEEKPVQDNRLWWYLGGGIALIFAFLILRRRSPPPQAPNQPIPPINPPSDGGYPQSPPL